jgi:quinol monooxygenase YgiN
MLVIHVFVEVLAEHIEAFKAASIANAQASVKESGIARFDVIQQQDDPTQFVLIEIYRHADAPAQHKETAHYLRWRDEVAPMMAKARHSIKYTNIFPTDAGW